jgi:branched-chain amino acid transport system substrate-binding protein
MCLRKSLLLALVLVLMLIFTAGCGSSDDSKEIKIGYAGPMTGDNALWGQSALKAAQIAVDEANANGGINGKKLVIVAGDDKGDPKEAASVAQKFVSDPNIVAVLGHVFSTCELTAGPIYQSAGMPNMVTCASNPKIPKIGDYVFRINVGDVVAAQQNADYVVNKLGLKKIAIIYDNMDYGIAYKDGFSAQAQKNGAVITDVETYVGSGQDRDFTVQLTKIAATNPDSIFLVSYATEAALIMQQARQLGIKAKFLGPDSLNTAHFLELAKGSAEGTVVATYFDRGVPDPKAKEFVEKYEKRYNEPTFTTAPYAYDAMNVVIDALKRAGKADRKALRDAIEQTKDLPGVTGTINFDKDGDRPVAWNVILEVVNGKFVVKDLIQ